MRFSLRPLCLAFLGLTLHLSAGDELTDAAVQGDLARVKAALAAGEGINEPDKRGWTPLMWAVFYQQDRLARWMVYHGGDPNAPSTRQWRSFPQGITPFWLVGYGGNEFLVPLFLASKADPQRRDGKGVTPVEVARLHNFHDCAALMEAKPSGALPLRAIPEDLADLSVLIRSPYPKSDKYLSLLKEELHNRLEAHRIRHRIQIEGFPAPQVTFQPKFTLVWTETAARGGKRKQPEESLKRRASDLQAVLTLAGGEKPCWEKSILATLRPALDNTEDWVLAERAVSALVEELQEDCLL